MPMTQDEARRLALDLPEVEESSHHGTPDLRVRNKIFATLPTGSGAMNLKTTPENLDMLVSRDPETFSRVWGERWVGVALARVEATEAALLLEDAWRLAAPKGLHGALE